MERRAIVTLSKKLLFRKYPYPPPQNFNFLGVREGLSKCMKLIGISRGLEGLKKIPSSSLLGGRIDIFSNCSFEKRNRYRLNGCSL